MEIQFFENEGKLEALLSKEARPALFNFYAHEIESRFNGYWLEKLDSFEQKYWDIKIGSEILTLHLEHIAGISLFHAQKTNDINIANQLVREIGAFLGTFDYKEQL